MPTVNLPDGRALNFPDGMSQEDMSAAILSLPKAAQPQAEAPQATLDQRLTASVPGRFGQGLRDPIDAGAQMIPRALGTLAGAVGLDKAAEYLLGDTQFLGMDIGVKAIDRTIREREAEYQAARSATGAKPEDWDVARGVGNVAVSAPIGIALGLPAAAGNTVLGLAGAGLLGGTVGGALTPIADEKDQKNFANVKLAQTGIGAAAGTVLGPVAGKSIQGVKALYNAAAPLATRALDTITGKGAERVAQATEKAGQVIAAAMKEIGQDADSIPAAQYASLRDQVAKSLVAGQKLDPAALLRKADFEAAGMPATLGQITRDPTQYAKEQNLRGVAGVGEPIMDILNTQTRKAQTDIAAVAKGGGIDTVRTGQEVGKLLEKMDESMGAEVDALYTAARDSSGKSLPVPLGGLASDAARIFKDYSDVMPPPVIERIKSFGMLGEKQTKVFDFEDANDLIKLINRRVDGADGPTRRALGEMREAVKRAMLDTDAPDVFAPPRDAARARFQLHSEIPALEAAASKDLTPDKFVQQYVVSAPTKDSARLAKLLQETNPEAFVATRAELGAVIQRAAFGENPASDAALKPAALAGILRNLGPQKLEAWFGPETAEQLSRHARVGGYAGSTPGRAAVSTSNSNPASMIANYGGMIPGGERVRMLAGLLQPIQNQRAVQAAVKAEVPRLAGSGESATTSLAKILASQAEGAAAADSVTNRKPLRIDINAENMRRATRGN